MINTTNTPEIIPSGPALKIDGLTVSYGDKTAIFAVDANFPTRLHVGHNWTEWGRKINAS